LGFNIDNLRPSNKFIKPFINLLTGILLLIIKSNARDFSKKDEYCEVEDNGEIAGTLLY